MTAPSASIESSLPDKESWSREAFSRSERIFGDSGMHKLRDAHVFVLGLGGVGSSVATTLARQGIGTLSLLDSDVIETSNINRQTFAFHSTLDQKKVAVASSLLRDINPALSLTTYDTFLTTDSLAEFLDGLNLSKIDFFVDALDSIAIKLALAQASEERGFKLISILGTANKLDPCAFEVCDLFETQNDSIARVMRKEARHRGIHALTVVASKERGAEIEAPEGSTRHDRADLGTTSYIPSIAGHIAAAYVIQQIVGCIPRASVKDRL